MKGTYLGEFEEIVLLTVASLDGGAYGNSVKSEIEGHTKRKLNISAVHSALYRLERKGFLKSETGEPTGKRGGKRKKIFLVTNLGRQALSDARDLREALWRSISPQTNLSTNELSTS